MTVTGTGGKGLNLVGTGAAANGLAGVYINGQGSEGVTIAASGTGSQDMYVIAPRVQFTGNLSVSGTVAPAAAGSGTQAPRLNQVSPAFTVTAGALPTQQFVSGAAAQVSTSGDVEVHTPVTFNPGVATTATCTVALSPDNTTFSTLCVWTEPVGVALDGTIHDVTVRVPAGWYLKLTVNAQAVLGVSTYY